MTVTITVTEGNEKDRRFLQLLTDRFHQNNGFGVALLGEVLDVRILSAEVSQDILNFNLNGKVVLHGGLAWRDEPSAVTTLKEP